MKCKRIKSRTAALLSLPHLICRADTVPANAEPLDDAEILLTLGGGVTFAFTGLMTPITGTSTWDSGTGTAFGTFLWDGMIRGTWNHR